MVFTGGRCLLLNFAWTAVLSLLDVSWTSLEPNLEPLGASWAALGASWAPCGPNLELLGSLLERSGAPCGPNLEALGRLLEVLDASWSRLGCSWAPLGGSWPPLGASGRLLEPTWVLLDASWAELERVFVPCTPVCAALPGLLKAMSCPVQRGHSYCRHELQVAHALDV